MKHRVRQGFVTLRNGARVLCAALAMTEFLLTSAALAQSGLADRSFIKESNELPSHSPSTFPGANGSVTDSPTIPVAADLYLPKSASSIRQVPAIVLLHGSSGFSNGYGGRLARAFARDGVAAMVVHSYRSRGVAGRPMAHDLKNMVPHLSQVADAYTALRHLSQRREIDRDRIYLAGFSIGGKISIFSALDRIARAFILGTRRFAGHISYWGLCDTLYEELPTTGAPILMMIGGKDSVTPVDRCEGAAASLRRAGSSVDLVVYDDAHHGWNGVDFAPRLFPERNNPAKCRWILSGDGMLEERSTGVSGTWDDPALAAGYRCLTRGYTIGRNERATTLSHVRVLSFMSVQRSR